MKFLCVIFMTLFVSGCVSMQPVDRCEAKVGGSPIELDGTTFILPVEMSVNMLGIWSTFRTVPEVCVKEI